MIKYIAAEITAAPTKLSRPSAKLFRKLHPPSMSVGKNTPKPAVVGATTNAYTPKIMV